METGTGVAGRGLRAGRSLPLVALLVLFLWTGLRGLDFGFHWDEPYHLETLVSTLERRVPLPEKYLYPQVSYWLTVLALLPDLPHALIAAPPVPEYLAAAVAGDRFLLRTRALFLIVSGLSLLFVYGMVRASSGGRLEALLAAALLGTSWEIAYHARWVAPDVILVTFACAALWGALRGRTQAQSSSWLVVAAIAAGLATGTKWTAGLLVLPVVLAAHERFAGRPLPQRLRVALGLCAVAAASYLVSTPGTFLDSATMLESLRTQNEVYGSGHLGHTVAPGAEHLLRVAEYLALAVPSAYGPIAMTLTGFALIGTIAIVRASPRLGLLLLSFPVTYLAFFAAYPTMLARNYLVLVPFFAVACAHGVITASRAAPAASLRVAVLGLVGAFLLVDAAWLVRAAESIREATPARNVSELARFIDSRPEVRFAASSRVHADFVDLGQVRPNVVAAPLDEVGYVVFWAGEDYARLVGLAPRFGLMTTWFGPFEVNLDYYPSWLGEDRILVMHVDDYPPRPYVAPDELPPNLRPGKAHR